MNPQSVFIVDDDVDFAESLAELLESRGYRCELAHSGEAAVARFRETSFDIAFLDVRMPGLNGVESFLQIRQLQPDAKVYMMTAYSSNELLQQALDAGALGVLAKPLDLERLTAKLNAMRAGQHILVVDDDSEFLELSGALLESANYSVTRVASGEEALQLLERQSFDLVLLDVLMPGLNGIQVYKRIRATGLRVPILFVTSPDRVRRELEDCVEAFDIEYVVYKPIDPAQLLNLIKQIEKS